MKINPKDKEFLKDNVDIVDEINSYVALKKKGTTYEASCPFHTEKTPSFKVFPNTQTYKCFGCGVQGDVISFVQHHESDCNTFVKAVLHLSKKHGIPITVMDDETEGISDEVSEIILANEYALNIFKATLFSPIGKKVRAYLHKRGYTKDLVHKWELGYAPLDYILQYDADILKKADLINAQGFPKFRDRLIFPIRNEVNQLVGFGGRRMNDDSKYAKYLNTGETPAYKKREILYGYNRARKRIKHLGYAVIVEGYTDVNLLDRADIREAVGICGTSFTDEQCRLITKHTKTPNIYIGDGDMAGRKAAKRVIEKHWLQSTHVAVYFPPIGEDPASIATKFGPDVDKHISEICPVNLIYQLAGEDKEKYPTREDQINAALESIALCPSGVKRHILLEQLSECSGMPISPLVREINRYTKRAIYR